MMNGSSSLESIPAKARWTGKPSPSNPRGAVVTERTERTRVVGSTLGSLVSVRVSAVTAGMESSPGQMLRSQVFNPATFWIFPASVPDGPGQAAPGLDALAVEHERQRR